MSRHRKSMDEGEQLHACHTGSETAVIGKSVALLVIHKVACTSCMTGGQYAGNTNNEVHAWICQRRPTLAREWGSLFISLQLCASSTDPVLGKAVAKLSKKRQWPCLSSSSQDIWRLPDQWLGVHQLEFVSIYPYIHPCSQPFIRQSQIATTPDSYSPQA
eukprot:scaffold261307_cov15-Tisochrysis_lutea.AAC.1